MVVGPAGLVDRKSGKWQPDAPAQLLGLPIRIDDRQLPGKMLSAGNTTIESIGALRPRARLDGQGTLRYEDGNAAGGERELTNGGRLIWCGDSSSIDRSAAPLDSSGLGCTAMLPPATSCMPRASL